MNNNLKLNGYSAVEVAKIVMKYSKEHGLEYSNLRVQKLLYFVQAYFIVALKKVCFNESILAWEYGPVVREVYDAIKNEEINLEEELFTHNISQEDKNIIENLVQNYKNKSTWELVEITYRQDTWVKAYPNNVITPKSIGDYFGK